MKSLNMLRLSALPLALATGLACAAPQPGDRVYTADQNTNTVSVIDPVSNALLGQIVLGNVRPDVLSPLYKGEINVHGMGFSPDHKSIVAVSNGSNSVTFIDTETNAVKGRTYIGRSPHEAFFTADGKQVWAVVRGEDYISVIDAATFKETARIPVPNGPGMVQFTPDGQRAFVVSSFTPDVVVIDVASHRIIKHIPVVSPFSPFLQFTPGFKEMWMTHKDVGKVTRIDTTTYEVKQVIDTGLITNHLAFARTARGVLAYVSVGGENVVKVYSTGAVAALVDTIPTGALPHGMWASDDGSRVYAGLENGDAVDVIDTATNKVIKQVPVGQAPQALLYVSHAVQGKQGGMHLAPRVNSDSVNVALKPTGKQGTGFVVVRRLGLFDSIESFLFKLKPNTVYKVWVSGQPAPIGAFTTNDKGMANGTAIGPLREVSDQAGKASQVYVTEAGKDGVADAVLRSE
ncbi:MAG: beta-propeller fold lactonase family protein [Massilia sp.]